MLYPLILVISRDVSPRTIFVISNDTHQVDRIWPEYSERGGQVSTAPFDSHRESDVRYESSLLERSAVCPVETRQNQGRVPAHQMNRHPKG